MGDFTSSDRLRPACATTNPEHVVENMAALRGPLPDREMRQRIVSQMETIPGFDRLGEIPWYPGKIFHGVVARVQHGFAVSALAKR